MNYTEEERTRLCCETVHNYIFDNVFNETSSEFRVNISPKLIRTTSSIGNVAIGSKNLLLPTTDTPYYTWVTSASDFVIGLKIPVGEWVNTETICNDYRTLIHMYSSDGHMLAKGSVFLRYNQSKTLLYIAVQKNMFKTCSSVDQLERCYLTIYYDSDIVNPISLASVFVEDSRLLQDYQRRIDALWSQVTDEAQLTVYKNGYEVTDVNVTPKLEIGNYIDIIVDKNIIGSFEIDLTHNNENPVFYSEIDRAYKQLIHIPRLLNPDNKVITHNTCDFYVRKALSSSTEGLYLHRIAQQRSVTQVTHNDMAIQLFVLDAYRDYLQSQEIKLYCVLRQHEKNNVLIRDSNFIDLLYSPDHTDDDIINILIGKGPTDITWWKAEHLEKSKYVEYMFDSPNDPIESELPNYVDALGYYQVVNLLCKRVVDSTITDAFNGSLTYRLPVIFYGKEVVPVLYLNGRPIDVDLYNYTNNSNSTVTVDIDTRLVTKPGDIITAVFYVTGNNNIYRCIPETANLSITVPYQNPLVYKKVTLASRDAVRGTNDNYTTVWELIAEGTNQYVISNTADGATVTFNFELVGQEFLICNRNNTYVQIFDLDNYTNDGRTIAIPLTGMYNGTYDSCPILDFNNLSLYLNNKYLVEGIDFTFNIVKDGSGRIAAKEVVIQTMDHFKEEGGDKLVVIINAAEVEDNSYGFVVESKLQDLSPVNLYFENISTVHVAGQIVREFTNHGTYIELPEDATRPQGQIYEVKTALPIVAKEFMANYAENHDLERMEVMNKYFYDKIFDQPEVLTLESKHRIYSSFVNSLLYSIVEGTLSVVNDPDLARFEAQIEPYLFLRDIDLCFKDLDQRFVDYYPQYVNYEVDPDTKQLLDRIITLYMPKNEDPTMEVVYG